MIASIAGLAAALLAALWWQARRTLRTTAAANARLAAALASAEGAVFRWRADGQEEAAAGKLADAGPLSFERFLRTLSSSDAERIAAAVAELRRSGTAFSSPAKGGDGKAYPIEGRRTATGDSVVWVAVGPALRQAEAARDEAAAEAAGLRAMLDRLPLPLWRRDRELRVVECNEAFAALLDLPREAVMAAPNGGETRDPTMALARAALAGEARSEQRHVVIAGSRRLMEFTEAPHGDGGTSGFALDRTELENAESEMARYVNAHGQVLESIHAAVAIYGPDRRLSFFNSAFAQLWGVEEEWLAGEPPLDELLERLRERRRVPEYADFRAFKRQQLEMFTSLIEPQTELMHLPDGATLSVSVSPHPLGGLIFVYEDVTDRLALERSYNTLIEVQRETLNNLFEGIAVFGSDGRLKLHNPAYRRIWSLADDDLEGEPHFAEIVDKTRAFFDGEWTATREDMVARIIGQPPWRGQLKRADGSVLQVATVPLPDGNMLLTCLDVTDPARVERALRERNEALETADRLKSEFIANVSYELRTPLNAIIGFAEILANQYFGTLSTRQLDYSRAILDSSHQLMALINDILDLATIEAGYMALETGPVDVRGMLESLVVLARERARTRELKLNLCCPTEIGAIEADERRLKQALYNLVLNAINFTPAGGEVRIEADDSDGDLVFAVVDTGVGIAPDDRERVFEKFERGGTHPRESGAGLGLALVKNLIELHGGTVAIESEPGVGTTVRCRLPARLRLPADQAAAS